MGYYFIQHTVIIHAVQSQSNAFGRRIAAEYSSLDRSGTSGNRGGKVGGAFAIGTARAGDDDELNKEKQEMHKHRKLGNAIILHMNIANMKTINLKSIT